MKRLFIVVATLAFAACSNLSDNVAKCYNGHFKGVVQENGVIAFKGIPYAKPPVGELRWKAPQPVEASDSLFEASEFGCSALQAYSPSEVASTYKRSENCLTLNVWTKDLKTKGKPVLFWIHGGSYSFGGTVDPLYDGQYLVADNPDIVVVTCNYRVNMMGFIDFSHVPGGEAFPDAPYLGIMDQQQAMRWVQQNIEAFGGDPDNVTIFGESAGGGSVSCHLVAKGSEHLFRRAIPMSGTLDLTFSQEQYDRYDQAGALLTLTGCHNMDELMALSEEDLLKALEMDAGRPGIEGMTTLAGLNNHPMRGDRSIIPLDPFKALEEGASKDVDVIIGCTSDEIRYWAHVMHNIEIDLVNGTTVNPESKDPLGFYYNYFVASKINDLRTFLGKDGSVIENYIAAVQCDHDSMSDQYPLIWEKTELLSELFFRMGSVRMAQGHAAACGKTYMYYFCKGYDPAGFPDQPWIGACHACELTYAFNNIKYEKGAPYDPQLTKNFSSSFVAFARTGDPSQANIPWTTYDTTNRITMVIGKDCSMKMVADPKKEQREIIYPYYCQFWNVR